MRTNRAPVAVFQFDSSLSEPPQTRVRPGKPQIYHKPSGTRHLSDGGFVIARVPVSITGRLVALVWIAYLLVRRRRPQKDTLGRFRRWIGRAILSTVPNAESRRSKSCPSPARLVIASPVAVPSWHQKENSHVNLEHPCGGLAGAQCSFVRSADVTAQSARAERSTIPMGDLWQPSDCHFPPHAEPR